MDNQPTPLDNQQPSYEDVPPVPAPIVDVTPVENVTPVSPAPSVDSSAANLRVAADAEPDTTPTVAPNPFFSQSNELPTTPVVQQPSFAPVTPAPMPTATPVSAPARKSRKKLAIILSIVGALIVLAVGGYFGVKLLGDQSSTVYAASVKAFSGKLDDIFNNATDVKGLNQSISSLSAPKLDTVPLSFISPRYTKQLSTSKNINSQYSTLKSQVGEYATLEDFYSQYQTINNQMVSDVGSIDTSSSSKTNTALDNAVADIQKAQQLVSSTNFPSSLSDTKQALQATYKAEAQSVGDVKTAYNNNDSAGVSAAISNLSGASQQEQTSLDKIKAYESDLNKKTMSTLSDIHKSTQAAING